MQADEKSTLARGARIVVPIFVVVLLVFGFALYREKQRRDSEVFVGLDMDAMAQVAVDYCTRTPDAPACAEVGDASARTPKPPRQP